MNPIQINPRIMGGTPCFGGTRVPVKNVFDYPTAGQSLDDFLGGFPTVTRKQATAVLEMARERVTRTPGAGRMRAALHVT
jgi:uncharacterized protein (DUF433 family)